MTDRGAEAHDQEVHEAALRLAETQHGLVSRTQLRELGVDRASVFRWTRSDQWERCSAEVLRRTGSADTVQQQVLTAVLDAGPGARLSHLSAANRWGRTGCRLFPVHAVRTGTSTRRPAGVVIHHVRSLPDHWTTELDGIPIARPELVAMQLFAACFEPRACRLTDRMWSDRLLSGPSIQRYLDQMGRSGRNGIGGLRRYLEARGGDYVPPASGLESRALELLDEAGIEMRCQIDSGDDHTWTGRVDFRHPLLALVIEVQSEKYHTALCDREADQARIERLVDAGYTVLEVTDTLVWADPAGFIRRALAAVDVARSRHPKLL